jgi:hypothetical protein
MRAEVERLKAEAERNQTEAQKVAAEVSKLKTNIANLKLLVIKVLLDGYNEEQRETSGVTAEYVLSTLRDGF